MPVNPEDLDAAEAVVIEMMKGEWSPRDIAESVLESRQMADLEPAQLYSLSLDTVDREHAVFSAAGGFTLRMHRGDWMERMRPSRIWITVAEGLESL